MGTPLEFITENNLDWQASFKDKTSAGNYAYRGDLVIEAGKVLSVDKQMPPKSVMRQVIMVADESSVKFIGGELESFDLFEPFFEQYKSILSSDGINTLFVIDLDADACFEYEGVTFNAFALDESSVWNELLDHADLEKSELKRLKADEKIDTLYDELKKTTLRCPAKTYEETLSLKNNEGKLVFGAV